MRRHRCVWVNNVSIKAASSKTHKISQRVCLRRFQKTLGFVSNHASIKPVLMAVRTLGTTGSESQTNLILTPFDTNVSICWYSTPEITRGLVRKSVKWLPPVPPSPRPIRATTSNPNAHCSATADRAETPQTPGIPGPGPLVEIHGRPTAYPSGGRNAQLAVGV